jgi:hypothetical protein
VPGLVLQSCRDPMGTNLASHWAWEVGAVPSPLHCGLTRCDLTTS